MKQAEDDLILLPTKYLMNIQNIIYEDVVKISSKRLQDRAVGVGQRMIGQRMIGQRDSCCGLYEDEDGDGDEDGRKIQKEDGNRLEKFEKRGYYDGKNLCGGEKISELEIYVRSMYELLQKQR